MTDAAARERAASDIVGIAGGPGTVEQRSTAILEALGKVVHFDAAWLAAHDPERQRHTPVASDGASEPLHDYFRTDAGEAEIELTGLSARRSVMLARDTPVPRTELVVWSEYLWPAGLQDGLAVALFTGPDRHVGFLCLLREDEDSVSREDGDFVTWLTPRIAAVLDRQRTLSAVARVIRHAVAGVILTRAGTVLSLDGLARHPLLLPGSDLLAVAVDRLDRGDVHVSFLWPTLGGSGPAHGLLRVTVISCASDIDHLRASVVLSAVDDPPALSHTDLRVIGALVDRWPVARIAAATGSTGTAMQERIRRISATMGAGSVPALVHRALRQGVYIPVHHPDLAGRSHAGLSRSRATS
jgi:hypothetical protein